MATHYSNTNFLVVFLISSLLITFSMAETPQSQEQLQCIVEVLINNGGFNYWAKLLSETYPSSFPLSSATLFIPTDDNNPLFNISYSKLDPSIMAYHSIPQLLTFSLLETFQVGSRIPTLLPNNTILVTNNSILNFTIDDIVITHPDLYKNEAIVVHGIGSLLNYSFYGGEINILDSNDGQDNEVPTGYQSPPVESPNVEGIYHKNPKLGLHRSNGQNVNPYNRSVVFLLNCILDVLLIKWLRENVDFENHVGLHYCFTVLMFTKLLYVMFY